VVPGLSDVEVVRRQAAHVGRPRVVHVDADDVVQAFDQREVEGVERREWRRQVHADVANRIRYHRGRRSRLVRVVLDTAGDQGDTRRQVRARTEDGAE